MRVQSKLEVLFEGLDEHAPFDTAESGAHAVAAMRGVQLEDVDEFLEQVRADDASMHRLAPMLGTHPLGFSKIVMWTSPQGTRARLHVWPPREWPVEQVHNHRFNFASVILAGSYVHERYDVSGEVPRRVAADELRTGDAYWFGTDQFHRTLPSKDLTISMVLRGRAMLANSTSVDLESGDRTEHYGSTDELRQAIDGARTLISEQGAV